MEKQVITKKLVSFSEMSNPIREKISQRSQENGLTESRIIEDCMICGFGFLYGSETDVSECVGIMKKRYGKLVDVDKLRNFMVKEREG